MRVYVQCAACGATLIKHPDEPATKIVWCSGCWRIHVK